jgi:hypothetical protein
MSRKMSKILILAAMVVTALASASSASATVWNSNGSGGGTGFTATAPASRLTLSGVSAGINCTGTSATGLLFGPTGDVVRDSPAAATLAFSGCRAGGFTSTASCGSLGIWWWIWGYTFPRGFYHLHGHLVIICTFTVPSIPNCRITVSPTNGINTALADDTYDNSTAKVTVNATGQAITSTWSSCGTLFGSASGSAATTFSDSTGAALVYTVTSAFRPSITI